MAKGKNRKKKAKVVEFLSPEKYIKTKSRNLPIDKCYISSNWKEAGFGLAFISRKHAGGSISFCAYMFDLYCRGIKDSMFEYNQSPLEFQKLIDEHNQSIEIKEIDYNLAHNIIFSAYEYALDLGINSHSSFEKTTKYFLEKGDENIPLIEVETGDNGVPHYFISPFDSVKTQHEMIRKLTAAVGEGNFNVSLIDDDDNEFEEGEEKWNEEEETIPEELLNNIFKATDEVEKMTLQEKINFIRDFDTDLEIHEDNEKINSKVKYLVIVDDLYYLDFKSSNNQEIRIEVEDDLGYPIDNKRSISAYLGVESVDASILNQIYEAMYENPSLLKNLRKKFGQNALFDLVEMNQLLEQDKFEENIELIQKIGKKYPSTFLGKFANFLLISKDEFIDIPPITSLVDKGMFINRMEHHFFLNEKISAKVMRDEKEYVSYFVDYLTENEFEDLDNLLLLDTVFKFKLARIYDLYFNDGDIPLKVIKSNNTLKSDMKKGSFKFKINLDGSKKPPIWREISISEHATFHDLHLAIQGAFGWLNIHLYQFSPKGYGSVPCLQFRDEEDDWDEVEFSASSSWPHGEYFDSKLITLNQYFEQVGDKMKYIYDFGDDWFHSIELKEVTQEISPKAICTKGKGAGAFEDSGGIYGFYDLIEILKDKNHEDYDDLISDYLLDDDEFDLNDFNLEDANSWMEELRDDG